MLNLYIYKYFIRLNNTHIDNAYETQILHTPLGVFQLHTQRRKVVFNLFVRICVMSYILRVDTYAVYTLFILQRVQNIKTVISRSWWHQCPHLDSLCGRNQQYPLKTHFFDLLILRSSHVYSSILLTRCVCVHACVCAARVCTCSCESGNFARINTNEPENDRKRGVLRFHVKRCISTIIQIKN